MRDSWLSRLGERRTGHLALLIALAGVGVRLWIAPSLGYDGVDGDLIEHKQAMHLALTEGISEIYRDNPTADPALTGHDWSGAYFSNQPPFIYLLRYLPVLGYRAWAPLGFALWSEKLNFFDLAQGDLAERLARSRGFTVALKFPGILADLALALGIFTFALPRAGPTVALGLCAAYALNPGIVMNTAFWDSPTPWPPGSWPSPLPACTASESRPPGVWVRLRCSPSRRRSPARPSC